MKLPHNAWELLFIFFVLGVAESRPRRLRVKTVANITSSTTPETSTAEQLPTSTTTTQKSILRRQRLRTTTTTTTEATTAGDATTIADLTTTTQHSRRRTKTAVRNSVNGHGNRTSNAGDGEEAAVQSVQRTLVKPTRNSTVYNFETGRLAVVRETTVKPPEDVVHVEETVVAPKRYSSRYSGKPARAEEPITEQGLLDDGDYREDSQGAYGEQVEEEEESPEPAEAYKEEQKKGAEGGKKETKGSGEEHHADTHAVKGNKDSKGYEGGHKFHKAEKGHHDKEHHKGEYKDEKGSKKSHKEGGGHFEAGHHGEKGEKAAEHAEKEEFKKGHSTRGGHVVHKKDEYEKKMEFYDESHEDGHGEKFGAHFESHGAKKGGHKKGGHKVGGSEGKHHAKKGHFAKGSHSSEHKGHDKKAGKDGMYGHMEKYGKESSKKDAKKYDYSTHSGKPKKGGDEKKKNLEEKQQLQEVAHENDEEEISETEPVKRVAKYQDESEQRPIKQLEKLRGQNVQYMNEDGPTSVISTKPEIIEEDEDENKAGHFITEEELLDDKEEAEALRVFDPIGHNHQDDGEEVSRRGYRVAEPDYEADEEEPQESQVQIVSSYHPVQIKARYRLPPIESS